MKNHLFSLFRLWLSLSMWLVASWLGLLVNKVFFYTFDSEKFRNLNQNCVFSDSRVSRTSTLLTVTFPSYWPSGSRNWDFYHHDRHLLLCSYTIDLLPAKFRMEWRWHRLLPRPESARKDHFHLSNTQKVRAWTLWAPREWREWQVSYAPQQSKRDPGSFFSRKRLADCVQRVR